MQEHDDVKLVSQITRFAVVGAINTGVDLGVLNALIFVSHRGQSGLLYSLFKAISFLVAVLNSYWLNSEWTFRQKEPESRSTRVGRFLSVSIVGLAVNVGIASWVAAFAGPVRWLARVWPSVAALAGAGGGLAFNFAGYKYLVFSRQTMERMGFLSKALGEEGASVPSIDQTLESASKRSLSQGLVRPTSARGRLG